MTSIAPLALLAPQTTGHHSGHPLGLPEPGTSKSQTTRIAGVGAHNSLTNTAARDFAQNRFAAKGGQFASSQQKTSTAGDQTETSAPPTILQLKITEMLQEQAEAIARNMPDDDTLDDVETPFGPATFGQNAQASENDPDIDQPSPTTLPVLFGTHVEDGEYAQERGSEPAADVTDTAERT